MVCPCCRFFGERIELISLLTRSDDKSIVHKYYQSGWSSSIDDLGIPSSRLVNGDRSISTWGVNRLDVFVNGGERIFHKFYSKDRWSDARDGFVGGWEELDTIHLETAGETVQINSSPADVSSKTERIDIFVRGYSFADRNSRIYHKNWTSAVARRYGLWSS